MSTHAGLTYAEIQGFRPRLRHFSAISGLLGIGDADRTVPIDQAVAFLSQEFANASAAARLTS